VFTTITNGNYGSLCVDVTGKLMISSASSSNLEALLNSADSALNGTIQFYFGYIVGDAGYLVYDQDGVGISNVIRLQGITALGLEDFTIGLTGILGGGG